MTAATGVERNVPVGRNWRDLAVCVQVDPELFHPLEERGKAHETQVAAAKLVCAGCPVREECLTFALRALPYGIAGGLTPDERRALRRPAAERAAVLEQAAIAAVTRRQRADAGRALLAAGRNVDEVARLCRVTVTSARRWAASMAARQLGGSA